MWSRRSPAAWRMVALLLSLLVMSAAQAQELPAVAGANPGDGLGFAGIAEARAALRAMPGMEASGSGGMEMLIRRWDGTRMTVWYFAHPHEPLRASVTRIHYSADTGRYQMRHFCTGTVGCPPESDRLGRQLVQHFERDVGQGQLTVPVVADAGASPRVPGGPPPPVPAPLPPAPPASAPATGALPGVLPLPRVQRRDDGRMPGDRR